MIPVAPFAQVTPAASLTPPDDTPSITLGVTLYTDYTYQDSPQIENADGNTINPNQFNVTRAKRDPNDQKAIEIRGTVRPLATGASLLRGWRVTGFYFGDNYIRASERTRGVFQTTYESKYLNAGFDYIDAHDQTSITARDIHSKGPSFWVNPKKPYSNGSSVELLFRYDHLNPDTSTDEARPRTIVGLAYWFPHSGNLQTTLMLDYDGQTFKNFPTAQLSQKKIAIHGQVIF